MKIATTTARDLKSAHVLTADSQGINLSMIGVPASLQKLRPTEGYYPNGFNPEARTHWQQLFQDPLFDQDMRALTDKGEAWLFTVRTFMDHCDKEGIDPFRSRRDPTVNNQVRKVLLARRLDLVRFIDRSRLFSVVKLEPMSAKHGYKDTYAGNLKIECSVEFMFGDRDALIAFARGPLRMLQDGNGGYTRNIIKTVTVGIDRIRSKKARLWYTIELSPPIYVPDDKKSKKAQHDWYDKELFFPTIRGCRFSSVLRRIKF